MKTPIVFLNGFFVELQNARVSVLDRGFCYGDGLFETMRAYNGKIFRLDLHVRRLLRSAGLIGLDLPVTAGELSFIIRETLGRNECRDAYVRLTVTRGESAPGLQIDPSVPPTLVVFAKPFDAPPESWYRDGAAISLFPSSAYRTSGVATQVKSCNYLSQILLRKMAQEKHSLEAILLDDRDRLTEGTASNIFLVKDGVLKTPPLSEYVLPGITRHVVLEIARNLGIPCSEEQMTRQNLYAADEAFLTNTGIEILPVCRADEIVIGSGKPGELTQKLRREFLERLTK